MKIAFIGLGNMGVPMAGNVIKQGFSVTVYNRTSSKTELLKEQGAAVAGTPREAVTGADVLVTMLSDDAAVSEISEKAIPYMKSGSVHLSMSTISPATVHQLQPLHKRHNIVYLASPVMGRPAAAASRSLYILLSGEMAAKQKVQPVLEAMGQRMFDFGEIPSAANHVKILMNMMIFVTVEMLSEIMIYAEKQQVGKSALLETMLNTLFGAPVTKTYGSLILEEKDNTNGFAMRLADKDIRLVQENASLAGMQLPLADLIHRHFQEAMKSGFENKDVSLLIQHLRNELVKK